MIFTFNSNRLLSATICGWAFLLNNSNSNAVSAATAVAPKVYVAEITAIPGTNSGVSGMVAVFTSGKDSSTVGYGGYLSGLQADLLAASAACSATNGCGVHIHTGTGCADNAAQGGHYFVDPITADPWADARYSSDSNGNVEFFADMRDIGTADVEGRAFVVHAADGSRVACGLLTAVADDDKLGTSLDPLTDAGVSSVLSAYPLVEKNMICYFGHATDLELNLRSVHDTTSATAIASGTDCTATNGCGAHVHAGTDCTDSSTQMGHYWNDQTLSSDPWAIVGYLSTSDVGFTHYVGCVNTGHADYNGRAFIVHANDGSRVSCGLLGAMADTPDPTIATPTSSPVAVDPTASPVADSAASGPVYLSLLTAAMAGLAVNVMRV